DVAVHVVGELVREHDFDLFIRVLRKHGVRDENTPGGADAGKRGIRFLRLAGESPLVGAEHARAGAIGERQKPTSQVIALKRLDRVEKRKQENWREVGEADDE